ncbi:MAG: hypothetical protein HKN85_03055, partial [Gammaproteobacteria bacterium]|nr:hypothetical protein [Gammaproteobacteria bacterium]
MQYKEAIDKSLALVLRAKDSTGKDEVAVFSGVFVKRGEEYFIKRNEEKDLEIREEWLERIETVTADWYDILLNCEYQLSLTVG